jgi:hypothetical protein
MNDPLEPEPWPGSEAEGEQSPSELPEGWPPDESAGVSPDEDDLADDTEDLSHLRISPERLEQLEPIPEELHSVYEDGPFSKCNICDKLLLDQDDVYNVEKVMRRGECIFEMAVCITCATNLHRQYSKDSRKALRKFFLEGYEPSLDTESCHLCKSASDEDSDRVLTAACARDRLVMPLVVVCSKCMERSQELLSQKTRETFRDFIETHFPGVPAEWEPAPTVVV